MADVVCLGEALIDFVATETGVGVGEAAGFVRAPGGAPANVAVGVARLGRTSAFLGKVGDDPFGRFLAQTLEGAGVDTGGMVFAAEYRTGLAFVALDAQRRPDFCFFRHPSADMTYRPEELERAKVTAGRIFHFGSITLIDEPARSTTRAAIVAAREAGLLVSYDPNLRPPLWPDLPTARAGILSAVPLVDLVKVSEEELIFLVAPAQHAAKLVTEMAVTACAERFLEQFPSVTLLAVTRGPRGCAWWTRGGDSGQIPGLSVDAVDTTGAGDGFVAGMLVGLMEQGCDSAARLADRDAVSLEPVFAGANLVGALTTLQPGAIPALPTAAQVLRFQRNLAEHRGGF